MSELFSTLIIIFLVAFLSSWVQRKKRDSVLKELEGFHVTANMKDGTKAWGKLKVFSRGIELLFSRSYLNHNQHNILSYIIFPDDLEQLEVLMRFHDELTPMNQKRRLKEIKRAKHPNPFRWFARKMINFLGMFHDAIDESLGILINRVKSTSSNKSSKAYTKNLKKLEENVMNIVDYASWNPILEYYLFKSVVLEMVNRQGGVTAYNGILKAYSSNWISILDCEINTIQRLPLYDANRMMLQRKLDFWVHIERNEKKITMILRVKNESPKEMLLTTLEAEGYSKKLDIRLKASESIDILLEDLPKELFRNFNDKDFPMNISLIGPERINPKVIQEIDVILPKLYLNYKAKQRVDIIVPRSAGVIRHGSGYNC